MKYGENIDRISVPKWNIHNVDYNSLKEFIKVNTRRDDAKAKAIAIPGQLDTARAELEEQLLGDLYLEHERVNLFVHTKTQELSRHLRYLSGQIHRLLIRWNQSSRTSPRRFAKLVKYEQELLPIGEDIDCLPRFVNAQAEAFRKIIKKYRKWTGSTTLGDRFKFEVLDDPKSFTHLSFSDLKKEFEEVVDDVQNVTSRTAVTATPATDGGGPTTSRRASIAGSEVLEGRRRDTFNRPRYWNEYEDGSEAGDATYEIYVIPDEDDDLLPAWVTRPFVAVASWFVRMGGHHHVDDEERASAPLLGGESSSLSYAGTATTPPTQDDSDNDDAGSSSADELSDNLETGYASLSIHDRKMEDFRNAALARGSLGLFFISSVFMLVAAILVSTGRHKKRVEVDVGVTIGIATALGCCFVGLAMFLLRTDRPAPAESMIVWVWFIIVCGGSGAFLVHVADRLT